MDSTRMHVSHAQFEDTAIAKLVSRGIREDVARMFVVEGLRKQNGYDKYRSIVCKAKFHSFFVHDSSRGAMVPTVVDLKVNKFHTQFVMSGREKAEMVAAFPEFHVVCDGKLRNPHAFYANKRLCESELLIAQVWATAAKDSSLNPRSVVDLGANEMQHVSRNRSYVHCDTPVLSVKDMARYAYREVYSGSDPAHRCTKTFQDCTVEADFAIAVHATYDLAPKQIASGMAKRGIKHFFGVMNVYPNIGGLTDGEFMHDGIRLKVDSNAVHYTFIHDPSLSYSHKKGILQSYISSQYSITVPTSSGYVNYTFKHLSVRGATVLFTIYQDQCPVPTGTSIATGLRHNKYVISVDALTKQPFEVDMELFDRMVLMAASSRNIEEYNISALFKYAKSLRQKISINTIVLSAGYRQDTQTLVWLTVAAMAVASAYHLEAGRYFKQASKDIMWKRSKSYGKELVEITSGVVSKIITVISSSVGIDSALGSVHVRVMELVTQMKSVVVSVGTIKDFGNRFNPLTLGPMAAQLGSPDYTLWFTGNVSHKASKPIDPDRLEAVIFPSTNGFRSEGELVVTSSGVITDYSDDLKVTRVHSRVVTPVPGLVSRTRSAGFKEVLYRVFLEYLNIAAISDMKPRCLPFGDSIVHIQGSTLDGNGDQFDHSFIVFRGVGRNFMYCEPPEFYTSKCLLFVLFYDDDISNLVHSAVAGHDVEDLPSELYSIVKNVAGEINVSQQESGVVYQGDTRLVIPNGRFFGTGPVGGRPTYSKAQWSTLRTKQADAWDEIIGDLDLSMSDAVDTGSIQLTPAEFNFYDSSDDENPLRAKVEEVDDDESSHLPQNVDHYHVSQHSRVRSDGSATTGISRGVYNRKRDKAKTDVVDDAYSAPGGSAPGRLQGGASSVAESYVGVEHESYGASSGDGGVLVEDVSHQSAGEPVESSHNDTDGFRALLRKEDDGAERRRNWSSESGESEGEVVPGMLAINELLKWTEAAEAVALSVGKRNMPFAIEAVSASLTAVQWNSINQGLEGQIVLCRVDDGVLKNVYTGEAVSHMAVTDGIAIYPRREVVSREGSIWITYSDLQVWVAGAIAKVASKYLFDSYSCPVVLEKGPAGCGKTTKIVRLIRKSDYCVCETNDAAEDTRVKLIRKSSDFSEFCPTVDSFLLNIRDVKPDVLFVDEALRLHAGKIWLLIKIMRPKKVLCFGDPEQIPVLPFVPEFEFKHHYMAYSEVKLVEETYRLPADVVMVLCESKLYDYKFKTHNPIMYGIKGIKQFYPGIFKEKDEKCVVLVYTKAARDDLRREGVSPVITIGESQGKDIDHVWIYRDNVISKDIYYDKHQTLTGITRVKKSITFVSASPFDDSGMSAIIKLLDDPVMHAKIPDYQYAKS